MPILSIYVGESQVSVLSFTSQTDYKFASYPYTFPRELLRRNTNQKKFYTQVLRYISKNFEIDFSTETKLLGSIGGVFSDIEGCKQASIFKAMDSIKNYNWIFVEPFTVATNQSQASYYPSKAGPVFSQPTVVNYLSNKALYPWLMPSSPDTFKAEDVLTKNLVTSLKLSEVSERPVLLSGGRFTSFKSNPAATYLLALDLVTPVGFHNLKLDTQNKFAAVSLLNRSLVGDAEDKTIQNNKEAISFLSDDMLSVNSDEVFDEEFISLGTLLNAPGGAECLFEAEAGSSQFVELKSGKLFIFPIQRGLSARVSVDGKSVGHIEKTIRGGELGFIVDTREKDSKEFLNISSTSISDWMKVINERIKAF